MHAWSRGGSLVDLEGEHGPASPLQLRGVPPHARGEHDQARVLRGRNLRRGGWNAAHADLAASITRVLGNALLGRCRVSSSDLKVRIEATDLSTFPDVTVVCGERQRARIDPNAVTNPTLLVEVTSTSTEDYDRGEKLGHYRQLPSLAAVLFVSHRRPQISVVERTTDGWQRREYRAGENVVLENPAVSFGVDEIYSGIELDEGRVAAHTDEFESTRRNVDSDARIDALVGEFRDELLGREFVVRLAVAPSASLSSPGASSMARSLSSGGQSSGRGAERAGARRVRSCSSSVTEGNVRQARACRGMPVTTWT